MFIPQHILNKIQRNNFIENLLLQNEIVFVIQIDNNNKFAMYNCLKIIPALHESLYAYLTFYDKIFRLKP